MVISSYILGILMKDINIYIIYKFNIYDRIKKNTRNHSKILFV